MVRRWSRLNYFNNFLNFTSKNFQGYGSYQNVQFSRSFLLKKINLTVFFRTKFLRRRHLNKLFFYQTPLLNWSRDYRTYYLIICNLFSFNIFKLNYLDFNNLLLKYHKTSQDQSSTQELKTLFTYKMLNSSVLSWGNFFHKINFYIGSSSFQNYPDIKQKNYKKLFKIKTNPSGYFYYSKNFLQTKHPTDLFSFSAFHLILSFIKFQKKLFILSQMQKINCLKKIKKVLKHLTFH